MAGTAGVVGDGRERNNGRVIGMLGTAGMTTVMVIFSSSVVALLLGLHGGRHEFRLYL